MDVYRFSSLLWINSNSSSSSPSSSSRTRGTAPLFSLAVWGKSPQSDFWCSTQGTYICTDSRWNMQIWRSSGRPAPRGSSVYVGGGVGGSEGAWQEACHCRIFSRVRLIVTCYSSFGGNLLWISYFILHVRFSTFFMESSQIAPPLPDFFALCHWFTTPMSFLHWYTSYKLNVYCPEKHDDKTNRFDSDWGTRQNTVNMTRSRTHNHTVRYSFYLLRK